MATFEQSFPSAAAELPPFLRTATPSGHPTECLEHEHLALIYDHQEEQFDIVIPFLKIGLERGEKSVFIVDGSTDEAVRGGMEGYGIDVERAIASGALVIMTKTDAYLKNGDFDPDWMIAFLKEAIDQAEAEGYKCLRASGEMTWALGPSGDAHNRLIEYECKLNNFYPAHNTNLICQYNRKRFRPETLMQVIHTHSRLVFGNRVCDNPHYISPDIYSAGHNTADAVKRLLDSLAENTELKMHLNAEAEALRQSEKRYRELLQALPVAVYTTDPDGKISLYNESATQLMGRNPQPLEDRWSIAHRLYRQDGTPVPASESAMAVTLRTGKEQRDLELMVERPDGSRVWVMPYPTVLRDAAGDVAGGINVLVDITERKLAEERQRQSDAALRKAEKFAIAGRMTATIAHEINNPLESIMNLWYLLDRSDLAPAERELVTCMGGELNRVAHITKQTLEFYREGKTPERVDLGRPIRDAIKFYARKTTAEGVMIYVDQKTAAAVIGLVGELRQLFLNLIGNALEAGAKNIRIRISPGREWNHASRRGMRIVMADDGSGIPAALLEKIFEPFFTTKDEKGAGLGLWVSKGIVQKHEGSITIRSSTRPGRSGTAFSLFFPTA